MCIEYKDDAYLREECLDGASLGFDGKQAIHPAQLDTIHQVYSPSEKGAYWAKPLLHGTRIYLQSCKTFLWLKPLCMRMKRASARTREPWDCHMRDRT